MKKEHKDEQEMSGKLAVKLQADLDVYKKGGQPTSATSDDLIAALRHEFRQEFEVLHQRASANEEMEIRIFK